LKNILYIHQYFKTPEEGGAIRSYYLAKGLAEHGYKVTMITSHNQKNKIVKDIDGIEVHYLPVSYDNKMSFFKRIWSFLSFLWLSYRYIRKLPKHDICYATSTPLTVGLIALLLKRYRKIPYYFEVRDLWPEAPIQMGIIHNPVLIYLLRKMEKMIYAGADKIIALSPGIRDNILETTPGKKVFLIPNMADTDFFSLQISADLKKKYGVADCFVMTYFGAIGDVNKLEYLLDVIHEAKKNDLKMKFLVMGKGRSLDFIRRKAGDLGLNDYVRFLPFGNKEKVREVMAITDATYISFADKPILSTNSPNKFFDALASGKLIVINHKGWINDMIKSHSCGFYVNPGKPESFAKKITPYLESHSRLIKAQQQARYLAEVYYSRELQVEKIIKVFDNEYVMKISEDQVYTLTA
jgi:glycosyltransferase involved in cell wall biosynthesis